MPDFADIYVLSKSRSTGAVLAFLETFATSRVEAAEEYEIPQYSDSPTHVFGNADSLIEHCCVNTNEPHAIYWHVSSSQAAHAMVFFLSDGHVIFGLSVDSENEAAISQLQHELIEHARTSDSLIAWEQRPPDSAIEFMRAAANGA
jgi:hypothetical protein